MSTYTNSLGTQRAGPSFVSTSKPTMAAAAGRSPASAAAATASSGGGSATAAPKSQQAATTGGGSATAAPKSAESSKKRPTPMPASLMERNPDAQSLPPKLLIALPSPRGPGGEPVIFIACASQHDGSLALFSDIGKLGTPGSEVFGFFVIGRPKTWGLLPGTAFLTQNKAKTEIVAHPAKFVGTAPELDHTKLRESLVAMFANQKADYIPTLDVNDFDIAVKFRELYERNKSVLQLVLPLASKSGSPWKMVIPHEKMEQLYERIQLVQESIGTIKVSKPRAARAATSTTTTGGGGGDPSDNADDDDDFMDIVMPVETTPRKRPAEDDAAQQAAPAAAAAQPKHKAVAGADGKPARVESAKPKAVAKFTGQLVVGGPETCYPVLLIPAQLFYEARELFHAIGVAGFSDDPEMIALTLTKTAMDDKVQAMLDGLTESQMLLMASITQPPTLSQTIVLDCNDQRQPVTLTQPDGSRVTGTINAIVPPSSEVYEALLNYRLRAAEWTRTQPMEVSEEPEEEREEEDEDEEEEDEEDEEEEEVDDVDDDETQ